MSVRRTLRRRGLVGVLHKIRHLFWQWITQLYYRPQFERLGKGTVILRPMMIANPGGITLGERCFVRDGARFEVVDRPNEVPGSLRIGDRVSIEQNVHIAAGGSVVIDDDVCLAARVSIMDTSHPIELGPGNRVNRVTGGRTWVRVGARAFIGTGAVILPCVTIGEDAVVGAGSVVTRDVPPRAVAAGAPARVMRFLSPAQGADQRE